MILDTGYLQSIENSFTTTTKHFIEMISSGIQVFSLQNGVENIEIGNQQEIMLTPDKFSFDMDNYVWIPSLSFKFFCYIVDSDKANQEFNRTLITDLKDLRNKGATDWNSCFNSTGNFFLMDFLYKKKKKKTNLVFLTFSKKNIFFHSPKYF